MIHRLKEELLIEEGDELTLSTQEFEEQTPEDGYLHLAAFSYEDTPIWRFLVNGVEIKKEIGMPQEENTVALRYEIKNRSSRNVEFVLTPFSSSYQREPISCRIRKSYLQKEQWKVKE